MDSVELGLVWVGLRMRSANAFGMLWTRFIDLCGFS